MLLRCCCARQGCSGCWSNLHNISWQQTAAAAAAAPDEPAVSQTVSCYLDVAFQTCRPTAKGFYRHAGNCSRRLVMKQQPLFIWKRRMERTMNYFSLLYTIRCTGCGLTCPSCEQSLRATGASFAGTGVENISRFKLSKIVTLINLTYWI